MESIAQQVLSQQPPVEGIQEESINLDAIESTEQETQIEKKPDDPRLSLIAKLERKIKLQEEQLKKEKQELETKYSKYKDIEDITSQLETNPLEVLKKKGWDLEKLNNWAIQNMGDDDLDPVAREFKNVRSELEKTKEELRKEYEEKLKAKEEEIRNKDYEMQIKQFKSDMKNYLVTNKDKYELINAEENGLDIVYDVIYEDLQRQVKEGKQGEALAPMEISVAADKVEAYLDTQVQKYLNLNKYKSKTTGQNDSLDDYLGKLSSSKTIDSSFSPKSTSVDELSEQERIKAATELVKRNFNF